MQRAMMDAANFKVDSADIELPLAMLILYT